MAAPDLAGARWIQRGRRWTLAAVPQSKTSCDYTRAYRDQIGATVVGRRVFDLTDRSDRKPPSGIDHVVVVPHRPPSDGWDPEAPFHAVVGVEAAVAHSTGAGR